MPREPRLLRVAPNFPHHLVLRGNNRRRLFTFPRCRRLFLQLLADASSRTGCAVHAWALMTNHVHLVVTPPDARSLSRCVQSFAQRYAWRRNRALGDSGKLFEERFFSEPLTSEAHLVATTAYVELNPVRAGVVADPATFPWTSYALHAALPAQVEPLVRALWSPHPWYSALGADVTSRARRYREVVATRAAEQQRLVGVEPPETARDYELVDRRRHDRTRVAEGATTLAYARLGNSAQEPSDSTGLALGCVSLGETRVAERATSAYARLGNSAQEPSDSKGLALGCVSLK
jgi:putative transposase